MVLGVADFCGFRAAASPLFVVAVVSGFALRCFCSGGCGILLVDLIVCGGKVWKDCGAGRKIPVLVTGGVGVPAPRGLHLDFGEEGKGLTPPEL